MQSARHRFLCTLKILLTHFNCDSHQPTKNNTLKQTTYTFILRLIVNLPIVFFFFFILLHNYLRTVHANKKKTRVIFNNLTLVTVNGDSKSLPPAKRKPHVLPPSNRVNFKSKTIFCRHSTKLRSRFTQKICFPDRMNLYIRGICRNSCFFSFKYNTNRWEIKLTTALMTCY